MNAQELGVSAVALLTAAYHAWQMTRKHTHTKHIDAAGLVHVRAV